VTAIVPISTHLAAPPDKAWLEANTTRLLRFVSAPMIRFAPIDPASWPERWEDGEYLCSMRLGGKLPIGRQVIAISRPAPEGDRRFLRDDGRGSGIRRWDHLITIEPDGEGTRYEDRLEVDAGLRTPLVAAFARRFYAHRQARWRKLVASGFDYGDDEKVEPSVNVNTEESTIASDRKLR
jgi:hypothetical protein